MNSLGVFDPESDEVNDVFEKQSGKSILPDGAPIPKSSTTSTNCNSQTPPNINIGKWSFHSRMVPENVDRLVNDDAVLEAAAANGSTTSPSNSTSWLAKNFSALKTTASTSSSSSTSSSVTTNTATAAKVDLGSYEKRKRYFADEKKRLDVTISPRHVYCMDFYDAYFDIANISLKLPGFSISIFKYWDQQPLRFVCKNRHDPSIVYFTVWFEWVDRATIEGGVIGGVVGSSSLSAEEASLRSFQQRNSVEVSSFHSVPEHVLRDSASEISSGSGIVKVQEEEEEEKGGVGGGNDDEVDQFENAESGDE